MNNENVIETIEKLFSLSLLVKEKPLNAYFNNGPVDVELTEEGKAAQEEIKDLLKAAGVDLVWKIEACVMLGKHLYNSDMFASLDHGSVFIPGWGRTHIENYESLARAYKVPTPQMAWYSLPEAIERVGNTRLRRYSYAYIQTYYLHHDSAKCWELEKQFGKSIQGFS